MKMKAIPDSNGERVPTRRKVKKNKPLWFFLSKHGSIAGKIFDLFEWNNHNFRGGIHFQDFHVIADGVSDGILELQFFVIGKHDLDPILHGALLSENHSTFDGTEIIEGESLIRMTVWSRPPRLSSPYREIHWLPALECR